MWAELKLTGIECRGILGIYPKERTQERVIVVDVSAKAQIAHAVESDTIQDAIDYEALSSLVRETVSQTQFELIESLGAFLLARLCAAYPLKDCVLTIHKPGALKHVADIALTFYQDDTPLLVK